MIYIIDHQDSFTWNVVHQFSKFDNVHCTNYFEIDEKKIKKIYQDSSRVFEYTEEQIIQADFNYQKQYDFLRIYQRIESISNAILSCVDQLVIFYQLKASFPKSLHSPILDIINTLVQQHELFKEALSNYEKEKQNIISIIHQVIELKHKSHQHYISSIKEIYVMANSGKLLIGNCIAIENIFEKLNSLGHSIQEASTSLEWLLIK